jgi:hypothetical protein
VLLVHGGAPQRRHERGRRPTVGAELTLERELVADELFNRESDPGRHRSPLDCISLVGRSVGLKGNAGMSRECVVCKAAPENFAACSLYISRTISDPNLLAP